MGKQYKCFVIMGFGPKTDYATGRILDLDKTYEHLIKPVFEELKIECFRADEIKHSGTIDIPMYQSIYEADIVVADISTLNPNALYELGVRHALKPHTTIVISEKQLKYPFDINHTVIEQYEHLGSDIGVSEARRFQKSLREKVNAILSNQQNDSPVYTYLPNLKPPTMPPAGKTNKKNIVKIAPQNKPEPAIRRNTGLKNLPQVGLNALSLENFTNTPQAISLKDVSQKAEEAKNSNNFKEAIILYRECLKIQPNNIFFKQRLTLVTYKSAQPTPEKALLEAKKLLAGLNPDTTTDPETLGLAGSIHKRLFELTNDAGNLESAIEYYRKGFRIHNDYYNGINFAFLLNVKANLQKDKYQAISYYLQANEVRNEVVMICQGIIKQKTFKDRGDTEWVYQSLAQAYLGLEQRKEMEALVPTIKKLSKGSFDLETFYVQNKKLTDMLSDFQKKHPYK